MTQSKRTLELNHVGPGRLVPKPMPPNITGVQPGGGWAVATELIWGRLRRGWLRAARPSYVARMHAVRRGDCPSCPHDLVDARDLKLYRNVCGYWFSRDDDRFRSRSRWPIARMAWAEVLVVGGALASLTVSAA